MKFLQRLFGPRVTSAPLSRPASATNLLWRMDASLPIPDWEAYHERAPVAANDAELHVWWGAVAHGWVDALQASLGAGSHAVAWSESFLLLSAMPARQNQLVLQVCERIRRHILRVLDGTASAEGFGPIVVLVLADAETYYRYIANYGDSDAQALSGGVFIDGGYGHFVTVSNQVDELEPILAHELTHCLLRHLPLPTWVNEGLAVCCEHGLVPHTGDPRYALYTPGEMAARHAGFWTAETIQQFWSGKSFLRPDIGNSLSYDLAERLVQRFARPGKPLRDFLLAVDAADGGAAAARDWFGLELEQLVTGVLGPGPWAPQPELWASGVEHGQFTVA